MSLIEDARKLEVFIYEEGMDYPAPTLEQLQALHDLWVVKDRAQGQEPVGFVRDDYKKTMNQYGSTILEPEKSEIRYVPLYTHAQDVAEIQAEALEKAAEAFTCIAPDINPFYELQNMAAKLRKGETL